MVLPSTLSVWADATQPIPLLQNWEGSVLRRLAPCASRARRWLDSQRQTWLFLAHHHAANRLLSRPLALKPWHWSGMPVCGNWAAMSASAVGIEPTSYGLEVRCSSSELRTDRAAMSSEAIRGNPGSWTNQWLLYRGYGEVKSGDAMTLGMSACLIDLPTKLNVQPAVWRDVDRLI